MSSFMTGMKANRAYRLHNTANQLLKIGEHEKAAKRLDTALRLYDEAYAEGNRRLIILMAYSILLLRKGQFAKAKDVLLVINSQPKLSKQDKYQLRVNYAICQWKLGNLDVALETIRKADADGKSSVIYSTMGMMLTEKAAATGDFAEALAYAQEALTYDEEDASALDNMGQVKYEMSRVAPDESSRSNLLNEAIEWFRKAYEVKPDQVTTLYFLAKLLNESGDRDGAREYAEKASDCLFTAMCQISREDIDRLKSEIGE